MEKLLLHNPITRNYFCKIYAADKLKNINFSKFRKSCIIIANTDVSTEKGEHWVAFYIPKQKSLPIEFFDSSGLSIDLHNIYIKKFLKSLGRRCIYLSHPIQSMESSSCGQYRCIYLLCK